jgi:anthranilate/para-aminobenzoate synthase component I
VAIASPEILLQSHDGKLMANPLAGTRRRGRDALEDDALRDELLGDPKEIAEHTLSVRTMLDELGPLCSPGSLVVTRSLDVSRHKRVQHLSSVIEGQLASGRTVLDALWAVFPGVTVTGFPKDPAIRIIRELESTTRGIFAGAIGTISPPGDCCMSLAIRGIYRHGRRSFVHAGAGIMRDSNPAAELAETEHKMSAMLEALAATQRPLGESPTH